MSILEALYAVAQNVPVWLIVIALVFSFSALSRYFGRFVSGYASVKLDHIWSPTFSLGTVGLIVGITAGVIGSIVGVIQIGTFFGWWPETLAAVPAQAVTE